VPIQEHFTQVAKWGNSLAIRIPAAVVEVLGLKPGDEVAVRVANRQELRLSRKLTREERLTRLRTLRGKLPPDFVFDRDEANAR
jgi:antitoxin MazE